MAVNRANFRGHYGKGKGHPGQLPCGRRKFQALIYETNYCHLFAANARTRSARVKQVESQFKNCQCGLQVPWIEAPPG